MKKLIASVALTLMGVGAAAADNCANPITTVTPGKLTVAAYDYPPFTIVGADGGISGVDPSIVYEIAKDNCLEVVPLVMDAAATTQSVISGKADLAIGSWWRTEKRTEVLGLSAPLYLDAMAIISKDGTDTLAGLEGKKVGTVTGYLWVEDMQAIYGDNLSLYPNPVAAAQDLAAGRIDAVTDGYGYAVYAQANAGAYAGVQIKLAQPDTRVGSSVTPPQTAILYTKGNDSLGKAIDTTVARLHSDGSIAKFLGVYNFDAKLADVGEPRLIK